MALTSGEFRANRHRSTLESYVRGLRTKTTIVSRISGSSRHGALWQAVTGSVEEKYPFEIECIAQGNFMDEVARWQTQGRL